LRRARLLVVFLFVVEEVEEFGIFGDIAVTVAGLALTRSAAGRAFDEIVIPGAVALGALAIAVQAAVARRRTVFTADFSKNESHGGPLPF